MSIFSVPPVPGGSTNPEPIANPSMLSTPIAPATSGAVTPFLMPLKRQRAFTSGPRGFTIWFSTESTESISTPPSGLEVYAGILYIHTNTTLKAHHAWLCDTSGKWISVTGVDDVKHPTISDRFLLVRSDGIPSWLTTVDYGAVQARRERGRR
jgi:hypothetical protein